MRMIRGPVAGMAIAACMAAAAPVKAQSTVDLGLDTLEIHGFVSQGFIKSTKNEYLARSRRGSFELTEIGVNFTKSFTDDLRVGLQLFAQDLGPNGNYRPQLDWYYLDWRLADWLGIRAGHTKIPFGLYNDSADVDAARVPVLLPQSVYPIDHREYLLAQTGGEIYGNRRLGPAGAVEYRAYGGTLNVATPPPPGPGIDIRDVDVPYVAGGRLTWSPPLDGLTLAGSYQALRIDWKYDFDPLLVPPFQALGLLPPNFGRTLDVKFKVTFWVGSLEYELENLLVSAEYSRWTGEFESQAPKLLPTRTVNERYYGMVSYRVSPWFTPGVYYSVYYPNLHRRKGHESYQRDAAVTFRYDINTHWLFKLEGHWMQGTAALDNKALNGGRAPKDLAPEWGVFLLRTTAYF